MNKFFIVCIIGLMLSGLAHAHNETRIGLSARVGYEVGDSFVPLFDPKDPDAFLVWPIGLTHNLVFNVGANIRVIPWLSIAPEFNVSFFKRSRDKETQLEARWHEFSLHALLMFHISYFYIGIGPGVVLNTAPIYTTVSNTINSNVAGLGDTLMSLGLKSKMSTRFSMVVDMGAIVPISDQGLNIQVGLRTSFLPVVLDKLFGSTYTIYEANSRYNGFSNRATSLVNVGLVVGILYYF
jgi:hypothetical protein